MALFAFRHDLIVVLLPRAVCVVDRVALHAVNLVLAALGLYGLKIIEVALTAFFCSERLNHPCVRVGRL
jgi:hypothetical protein